ncbi:MAG: ATP-binding protein [Candidatus Paceibacterota bacterium]|jgi:signal transduction histidine kinase
MFVYSVVVTSLGGLTALVLGWLVFLKNKKNPVNRTFFLMNMAGVVWTSANVIWLFQKTETSLLFWAHIFYLGSILFPIFFLHWVLALLDKVKENKKILVVAYTISFCFFLLSFSPWFISGLRQILPYQPPGPQAGPLFTANMIYSWGILTGFAFFQLVKSFKKAAGYKRAQIKYVILGIALGVVAGMSNFPLSFGIRVDPWGLPLISIYTFIYAYAIIKYRLMDIRLIIKRTIIFSVVVILVSVIYVLATFFFSSLIFGKYIGPDGIKPMILSGLLVSLLVAFGIKPLYAFLENSTDKIFFKGEYRSQELIKTIFEKLITSLETIKIHQTLSEEIVKAMKLEGATFFDLSISINKLPIDNLIKYLSENKETLVVQEMKLEYQDGLKRDQRYLAFKDLEQTPAAVVLPIYKKSELGEDKTAGHGRLSTLLILQDKKSGDTFTSQDIQTLELIASQASIALDNAKMYEEIKQLLEAKTRLVSIVSHQIKNPLAIIKGYASLIDTGAYSKKDQVKEVAVKIKQTSDRLFLMVNNILDTQRVESGTLEYEFKKIDLKKMVEEAAERIQVLTKEKGLNFELDLEPKEVFVMADEIKLYQCVINLLDNAVKFTDSGFIKAKLSIDNDWAIFEVLDSGRGIERDILPKLFNKFERGGEEVLSGFGLGLYVVKLFVDAHHGEIGAESDGKDKGSKFFIKLRLAK